MAESIFFRNLTTKGLTAINSGERYFEGYLTVQVKDKQGEVTIVDELMKVLPIWIDRGAPISDTHSNRIIGKGINYSKVVYKDTDGEEYPAIKITGKIHKNYELDNDIWAKIKSGQYKGLSFGGATKADREPMRMKDGSIAYSLKDLEHYEVAVCADPAVPLALITEFNTLAKAAVDGVDIGNGRMLIKCDKYGCYVDKEDKEDKPMSKNEKLYRMTTLTPHGEKEPEDKRSENEIIDDRRMRETGKPWDCPWCEGEAKNWATLMPNEKDEASMKQYKEHKDSTHKHRSVGGHQKKKDNSEAGLKAPEASKEALVYDDKTLDQPSETPLENQAKIKKGQKEEGEGTLQRVEEYEAVGRHAEGKPKGVRDVAVAGEEDMPKQKQIRHEVADEKGYRGKTHKLEHAKEDIDEHIEEMKKGEDKTYGEYCTNCGDRKPLNRKVVTSYQDNGVSERSSMHMQDAETASSPHCPNCKKKGEDWSNADGDRHGMYNQDTDEGGMGKKHTGVKGCKCGDPKCKDPKCKKHKREVGTGYGAEQSDVGEVQWTGTGTPYPKKKAIMTNIHSRLKSLEFLLMSQKIRGFSAIRDEVDDAAEEKDKPSKEQQTHNTPNPPKKYITEEEKPDNPYEFIRVEREEPDDRLGGKKINEAKLLEGQDKKVKRKLHEKSVITNIHSRLKSLDFLLRKEPILSNSWEAVRLDEKEQEEKKKKKKVKKDGEFGGMNTGEVEWTEPRDTANSRTKRKEENVA